MIEPDKARRPLVDPSVLEMLRAGLDDDGVWKAFVRNFIENLPHRNERLRLTLTTGDLAGALDAVLSLKTSSQMVGGELLAALALDLEQSIHAAIREEADPALTLPRLAAAHLRQIKQCSQETIYRLQVRPRSLP